MNYTQTPGQLHIKEHLQKSISSGRIPHAQIFSGPEGSGALSLALAYAQQLLEIDSKDPESSRIKVEKLSHPDLHLIFPVSTTTKVKKHPISSLFLEEFRSFVQQQAFGSYFDWMKFIGADKKQGQIGVDEASDLLKKMALKSYEGGLKVVLIWQADQMNNAASNKLLKLIEEPPKNTIFLLITEHYDNLISTIRSRCQLIEFNKIDQSSGIQYLQERFPDQSHSALEIAFNQSESKLNKATQILEDPTNEQEFEKWFITWVRAAFKAKGDASVIETLIDWSEDIAASGRDHQKQFLAYCIEFFRQAMMLNYGVSQLKYINTSTPGFAIEKFAPFIHGGNIQEITEELNKASYHIERNGNAKLILLDTSIKLTRLLHQKQS